MICQHWVVLPWSGREMKSGTIFEKRDASTSRMVPSSRTGIRTRKWVLLLCIVLIHDCFREEKKMMMVMAFFLPTPCFKRQSLPPSSCCNQHSNYNTLHSSGVIVSSSLFSTNKKHESTTLEQEIDTTNRKEDIQTNDDSSIVEPSSLSLLAPFHTSKERLENKHVGTNNNDDIYIPPWLTKYSSSNNNNKDDFIQAQYHMQLLKSLLSRPYVREKLIQTDLQSSNTETHVKQTIQEILEAVVDAARGKFRLIIGASEFLCLMIHADDHTLDDEDFTVDNNNNNIPTVVSRDTLIAAAFHYCDCVMAREAGIYNIVKDVMRMKHVTESNSKLLSPSTKLTIENKKLLPPMVDPYKQPSTTDYQIDDTIVIDAPDSLDPIYENKYDTKDSKKRQGDIMLVEKDNESETTESKYKSENRINKYGEETVRIALSAAQVKRAELMADSIYTSDCLPTRVTPLPLEAERTRGLILSMTEDWRALVIRAVACLFRLRGILRHSMSNDAKENFNSKESDNNVDNSSEINFIRTPETMRIAREALQIYAPLAQRVGYYRLKADLENMAFRILYPRQYSTVELMYEKRGSLYRIQSVADAITTKVKDTLTNDQRLIENLDEITVYSRVKEPYSLWRKIVKKRLSRSTDILQSDKLQGGSFIEKSNTPLTLSITEVDDCIALRVIIKAKKSDETESDESTEMREKVLCYCVQKLLSDIWPPTRSDQMKDYIRVPKQNGYQSLHYISSFKHFKQEWPFEIQIRTESMHRVAEYGFAGELKHNNNDKNCSFKQ